MSDWAEGLASDFAPPDNSGGWVSGYDLPAGQLTAAAPPGPAFSDVVNGIGSAVRTVTGIVTARDAYLDNRLDRSVNRDIKLLNAQTARDVAGIQAQTARVNAVGGLNWARLQAQPSQFGLGTAANDRLMLLLAAVGVVVAILQYSKDSK